MLVKKRFFMQVSSWIVNSKKKTPHNSHLKLGKEGYWLSEKGKAELAVDGKRKGETTMGGEGDVGVPG